jgi:hypothetical protein
VCAEPPTPTHCGSAQIAARPSAWQQHLCGGRLRMRSHPAAVPVSVQGRKQQLGWAAGDCCRGGLEALPPFSGVECLRALASAAQCAGARLAVAIGPLFLSGPRALNGMMSGRATHLVAEQWALHPGATSNGVAPCETNNGATRPGETKRGPAPF